MRCVLLFLLSLTPTAFAAEKLLIDHATIAGADLGTMTTVLANAAGVQPEYGGPHSNHATEMALISFPDGSYLELMGIQKQADPVALSMHVWSTFLKANAGPCAFALRVGDIGAEVRQLRESGIEVGATEASGRTRPDGVKIAWQTVNVGPGNRGSLFPFLIRDETPRENRVFPGGKPTTDRLSGVAKVIIGVHNLETAIALYRKAFHLPAPQRMKDDAVGANLAWFRDTPVVLAQGTDSHSWLTERVQQFGDAPAAIILRSNGVIEGFARRSQWFGRTVDWLDTGKFDWHIGIEPAR